jgi:hypothetical protein
VASTQSAEQMAVMEGVAPLMIMIIDDVLSLGGALGENGLDEIAYGQVRRNSPSLPISHFPMARAQPPKFCVLKGIYSSL